MTMTNSTEHFRDSLRAARRSGTPLIAVRTADPASAVNHFVCSLNGKADVTPLLQYDIINGLTGTNKVGRAAASSLGDLSPDPVETLAALPKITGDSVIFMLNVQRIWDSPPVIQGIWNLRDIFKRADGGQMLVLLTTIGAVLPSELQSDVMIFDEPLPSPTDLESIITTTFDDAELPAPDAPLRTKAVDALIGLPSFPAEQVLAMSLSKTGVDLEMLWERKRQAIEQTRGLTVWRGGETLDEQGGSENAKEAVLDNLHGLEPARVIVFVDEIEKAFAGSGTDMSGTKTELTGCILSWLQDHNADGMIFIGPPGAGKSAIAKAAGASVGIPTIAFDFSAMQSGIVGSSGENLRSGLAVVEAVSQGRSLWIATCNSITSLPPELRRRFPDVFFFDLPDAAERDTIWKIYEKKWNLSGQRPDDTGWTGAEIRNCCRKAWRQQISLLKAGTYIVPVSKADPEKIERLRRESSGKFLSAAHPGLYEYDPQALAVAAPGGRKIRKEN